MNDLERFYPSKTQQNKEIEMVLITKPVELNQWGNGYDYVVEIDGVSHVWQIGSDSQMLGKIDQINEGNRFSFVRVPGARQGQSYYNLQASDGTPILPPKKTPMTQTQLEGKQAVAEMAKDHSQDKRQEAIWRGQSANWAHQEYLKDKIDKTDVPKAAKDWYNLMHDYMVDGLELPF